MLAWLRGQHRALTYMETHAGRGLYDLTAAEAVKTGEAAAGWLAASQEPARLPGSLVEIVKGLNGGALAPFYPGSPMIAARMLRGQDRLILMDLHPREFAALSENFSGDARVRVEKVDGYEGVLAACPPVPRRGMVLIDPSYEIKDEYLGVAAFTARLRRRWPDAAVMIWYPLLAAGRHDEMLGAIAGAGEDIIYNEYIWAGPETATGMYGSGIALLHFDGQLQGFRKY